MRRLKLALLMGCLAISALSGCDEADLSKPPKMNYGRDVCEQCRMIVQDERFAAAILSKDRRYLKFDDLCCMAAYEKNHPTGHLMAWVHDMTDGNWIILNEAYFVYHQDLVTPMGYGVAAFKSAEEAEKYLKEINGRIVQWNQLIAEEIK